MLTLTCVEYIEVQSLRDGIYLMQPSSINNSLEHMERKMNLDYIGLCSLSLIRPEKIASVKLIQIESVFMSST